MTRLGTKAINYSVDIGLDEDPKENASKFENLTFDFTNFLGDFQFHFCYVFV